MELWRWRRLLSSWLRALRASSTSSLGKQPCCLREAMIASSRPLAASSSLIHRSIGEVDRARWSLPSASSSARDQRRCCELFARPAHRSAGGVNGARWPLPSASSSARDQRHCRWQSLLLIFLPARNNKEKGAGDLAKRDDEQSEDECPRELIY